MRFRYLILPVFVAACSSQSRPEDDPWANYQPSNRSTYDENYTPPPREDPADAAVRRARVAEGRSRPDEARVEYQSAFRHDRWHVPANQEYQDLMIRNGMFDALWREYLDLWQYHEQRGDALYFHLRPLLTHRGVGAAKLESLPDLPQETIDAIGALLKESTAYARAGDREGALAAIDKTLKQSDMPVLHRVRIELLAPVSYDELLEEYETRAEDAPQSGDALALHANVVGHRDKHKAVNLLREGYVLELPGFWLPYTLAELCRDLGDEVMAGAGETPDRDFKRNALGWYAAARDFFEICKATRPGDSDTLQGLGYVEGRIESVQ